jgi:hypothetical protein
MMGMNVTPEQLKQLASATARLVSAIKSAVTRKRAKKEEPLLEMIVRLADRAVGRDPEDELAKEALQLVEDYRKENGVA